MLTTMTSMTSALRQHLPDSLKPHTTTPNRREDIGSFYKDHVAAITGAGSGIGRALAIHLAKMGCDVALSDINPEQLAETQKLLAGHDIKSTITILDVTTHRMPHISRMNTNLILTARFEFELHQRMSGGTL